ncbi:ATP-binding protein [Actinoplanes sp. NPDC049265]|uniref:ATP-binding protein n=1 Tax=Actinoplanes sp. NPDC049265 TaxID=3363902 RepID=UPI003719E011
MDETRGRRRGLDAARPVAPREPVARAATSDDLYDQVFGPDDITVIRHGVHGRLVDAGFTGDRLQAFVLAINEIITNVVLHAGGRGRIVVSRSGQSIWCTITDSGPGIPARFQHPPEVPDTFDVSGRGIWLAHRLCDEVSMATGPIGTTIGLRMACSAAHITSDLVNGASSGV